MTVNARLWALGNVCLLTSTGCRLMLKDVRHVPDVRLNLNRLDGKMTKATMVVFEMVHGSSVKGV